MRTGEFVVEREFADDGFGDIGFERNARESSISRAAVLPGVARSPTSACLRVMTPAKGAVVV